MHINMVSLTTGVNNRVVNFHINGVTISIASHFCEWYAQMIVTDCKIYVLVLPSNTKLVVIFPCSSFILDFVSCIITKEHN
jgi:hypothetical protein